MQPIFTIHAGEYLVGNKIEKEFGKFLNVWIPAKDDGIDLLVTDKSNTYNVSIQVKYSKDFLLTSMDRRFHEKLLACGWWTLNRDKLLKSKANFWIFALHSFKSKIVQYVIINPKKLLGIYDDLDRKSNIIQTYIWITDSKPKKCWEARDLKLEQQLSLLTGEFNDEIRNLTPYLEDWNSIFGHLIVKNKNHK